MGRGLPRCKRVWQLATEYLPLGDCRSREGVTAHGPNPHFEDANTRKLVTSWRGNSSSCCTFLNVRIIYWSHSSKFYSSRRSGNCLNSCAEPVSTTEPAHSVRFSLIVGFERSVEHSLRVDFGPPVHLFHHSDLGWTSFSSSALMSPEKAIPKFGTSLVPRPPYHSPLRHRREPASWLSTSSQTSVVIEPLVHRVSLETVSAV